MTVDKLSSVGRVQGLLNIHGRDSLKKGDLFYGKVVDIKGNQVTLSIRGNQVTATSSVPIDLNETALFQVKDIKNNLLVLQKLQGTSLQGTSPLLIERDLSTVLNALGLEDSPGAEKILSHLLSKGLPVDKNLVQEMIKSLTIIPESLQETYIKVQAWLLGAGITNPDIQKKIFSVLFNNDKMLNLLKNILPFFQGFSIDMAEEIPVSVLLSFLIDDDIKKNSLADEEKIQEQLKDLLTSQKMINQCKTNNSRLPDIFYFPLLLKDGKEKLLGEAYFAMEEKSRTGFEKPISLVLSLRTEYIGKLWFHIIAKHTALNLNVYTENSNVADYIKGTWEELRDTVSSIGFKIDSFLCREKTVSSVFELIDDLGQESTYRSVNTRV